MGHRTSISDYAMDCATTRGPEVEGYDIEAEREKAAKSTTKSKKVEPRDGDEPKVSSVAKTKSK